VVHVQQLFINLRMAAGSGPRNVYREVRGIAQTLRIACHTFTQTSHGGSIGQQINPEVSNDTEMLRLIVENWDLNDDEQKTNCLESLGRPLFDRAPKELEHFFELGDKLYLKSKAKFTFKLQVMLTEAGRLKLIEADMLRGMVEHLKDYIDAKEIYGALDMKD
jgi:hypothetical protein